ncbi:MAG: LamG-like jellyroll fold domain-containing protein [Verrucomicrobiota bacterium JB024]|nr:LamG-like jellyroll fold domain-containing protein [Verrucomicrobiota bacterium JB024]
MNLKLTSLLLVSLAPFLGQAADTPLGDKLVLELTFDQPGEAGTVMLDAEQKPADLRGAEGSGLGAGRPFDNTAALGMGGNNKNPGSGPQLKLDKGSELVAGAKSFTLQGWYRTETGQTPGNYARLFATARVTCNFDNKDGRGLSISINKEAALCPDGAFRTADEWTFFALTYDGTKTTDNLLFYVGSQSEPVRLVARLNLPAGTVYESGSNQPLTVGNLPSGDRPFDGLLDNFRLWVDKSGAGAVLNESQLEQVRKSDH